jgi:hypothetical protein
MTPPWKNPPSHGVLQAVESFPKGFIGLNGKEIVAENIALKGILSSKKRKLKIVTR